MKKQTNKTRNPKTKTPKISKEEAELQRNREEFLRIAKPYFDEHGLELTPENGEKIPKETQVHETGLKEGWSIDVFILTAQGITTAYYRGTDPNFTAVGFGVFDRYIKDISMVSNKFLYSIDNLIPLIDHLKVI